MRRHRKDAAELIISAVFPNDKELKPESIIAKWKEITTFGE